MQHTHIILTQTLVDLGKMKMAILNEWERVGDLQIVLQKLNKLDFQDTQINSSKAFLQMPKDGKDDHKMEVVRDFLDKIYVKYTTPTILFFQNLENYDEAVHQKLLKILEEPPENLIPVLFASNLNQILPTIQSRANIIELKKDTIYKILDLKMLDDAKKKIGDVAVFVSDWLGKKDILPFINSLDFAKIERNDIGLWLWMVQNYLEKMSEKNTKDATTLMFFATRALQINEAMTYNLANVQKKFVFFSLL